MGGGVLRAGVVDILYSILRRYCISPCPKHDVGGGWFGAAVLFGVGSGLFYCT